MIIALLATFISISSSAQTLTDTLNRANADWATADQNFKAQLANSAKYSPCEIAVSDLHMVYADWYRKNAAEVFKQYYNLEELFKYSNAKILQLREMTHMVLAVPGQNEDQQVTFKKVIDYLQDLNIRAKNSKKLGQYETFKRQIAQPRYSPFQLSLDQVIAAVKKMTENMNASLRDRGVTFVVKYAEGDASFTFDLEIKMDAFNTPMIISLLEGASAVSISEKEKWHVLSDVQVAGHSIDAQLRFNEFVGESPAPECLKGAELETLDTPYLSPIQFKTTQPAPLIVGRTKVKNILKNSLCAFGRSTETVSFKDSIATIKTWGSTRAEAQGSHPVQVNSDGRVFVKWHSNYGPIWFQANRDGGLDSSHPPVTCTFGQQ